MTASEFSGLALSIEPVRGVRSFDVDPLGRLTGVSYRQVWTPGENESQCHSPFQLPWGGGFISGFVNQPALARAMGIALPAAAPETPATVEPQDHDMGTCRCGFYAHYDGSNDYRQDDRVSAVVEGYGETVIGTRGFRAGKARIVALCIPQDTPARDTRWARWNPYRRLVQWLSEHPGVDAVVPAMLAIALAVLAGIAGIAPGMPVHRAALLIPGLCLAVLGGLMLRADYAAWETRLHQTPPTKPALPTELIERVRRNYQDVPIYTDFDAMLRDFPPDRGQEPTPDTDPDFWTRSAS